MITSMTGFGRGSAEGQGGTIGVEVRSVNSRFLDIQVRSPQLLQTYEQAVRERVQKAVARGKVSVHISWEEGAQGRQGGAPARARVGGASTKCFSPKTCAYELCCRS